MHQSFFVDTQVGGVRYLILDTVIDGKHVFTACGQGRVAKGDVELTATGQATLHALGDYAKHAGLGRLHMVEIATTAAAPVRVRKALEAADQKEIVFFVCRGPLVYDAAVEQLHVIWPEATGPQ